jgi:hypothetical protein
MEVACVKGTPEMNQRQAGNEPEADLKTDESRRICYPTSPFGLVACGCSRYNSTRHVTRAGIHRKIIAVKRFQDGISTGSVADIGIDDKDSRAAHPPALVWFPPRPVAGTMWP